MKTQNTEREQIINFLEKDPFAVDGLNMKEFINLLKQNSIKTTPQKLLDIFEKNEYGHYKLRVQNEYYLISLYPPETDNTNERKCDRKFRPKAWGCQVIGNV